MKKLVPLVISLIVTALVVSGCDANSANPPNPIEQAEAENLLSEAQPIAEPQNPTPTIPIPPPPQYNPFPRDAGNQFGSSPGDFPGPWQIATPLYPNFNILSAELEVCDSQVYVKIAVKNAGPYYFQWVSLSIYHGGYSHYNYNWEDPWVVDGSACPVPSPANPSLAPGDTAFIYFPITPVYPETEYDIHLWMCSYTSIPDPCMNRTYLLDENIWAVHAIPPLDIREMVLCWVGPGPLFEVVNSIPAGSEVELLGIGDVEGFLVVQEPKYQRPCWLQEEFAGEVPEEVLRSLSTFETPLLPEGVVSGRVFKDQDANGAFGGADVGLPSARVSLAPGTCSNYGQAMTTTTNSDGWFSFSNVEPGPFCLFVPMPSTCKKFSTADSFDLAVDWGSVQEKNFGLEGCR